MILLPLFVTPAIFKPGSKLFKDKNIWIPDKRFREWRKKEVVTPEWFYEGSKLFKGKNMGSHLLVTPAIFKPGSTVFKTKEKSMDAW